MAKKRRVAIDQTEQPAQKPMARSRSNASPSVPTGDARHISRIRFGRFSPSERTQKPKARKHKSGQRKTD